MSKYVSIMIVPHDDTKTRNYRVSYRRLYFLCALGIVLIAAAFVSVLTYGKVLFAAGQTLNLREENTMLRGQLAQIDSLRLELVNLQALSIQVKGMLGVELSREDSLLVANLSPTAQSPAISNRDLEEGVAATEQQKMLDALPSMWPVKGYVTRTFHVIGGETNPDFHPGMDIAAERNTAVRAAADGVVVASKHDETYGYMVEIDHGFGIHTLYGHNARNLVNVGDRVTRGKTIAFLGSTGKSTAPHVHFEVRKNGVPVDPEEYLLN